MNGNWTNKWKKVLIWVSGYINFIAFALVGGYVIVKEKDEDLRKTTKLAFIVTLIFTALNAIIALYSHFAGFNENYYGSNLYTAYTVLTHIVAIAQIITYTTFVLLAFLKTDDVKIEDAPNEEKNEEE